MHNHKKEKKEALKKKKKSRDGGGNQQKKYNVLFFCFLRSLYVELMYTVKIMMTKMGHMNEYDNENDDNDNEPYECE